jgi:hypothetical protein
MNLRNKTINVYFGATYVAHEVAAPASPASVKPWVQSPLPPKKINEIKLKIVCLKQEINDQCSKHGIQGIWQNEYNPTYWYSFVILLNYVVFLIPEPLSLCPCSEANFYFASVLRQSLKS